MCGIRVRLRKALNACVGAVREVVFDNVAAAGVQQIIGLLVVLLLFGATIGVGMDSIIAINTTGWPAPVATIFENTLPLIIGIGGIILILRSTGIMRG